MSRAQTHIEDWLELIRAEYLEIPGLCLTKPQVERLWGLDAVTSEALLSALVDANFLRRTGKDAYVRAESAYCEESVELPLRQGEQFAVLPARPAHLRN